MRQANLLIGGQDRAASDGATFDRVSPVTGEAVTRSAAATLIDADAAVDAAQKAFPAWAGLSPNDRRRRLLKAAVACHAKYLRDRPEGNHGHSDRPDDDPKPEIPT
jgi:acyl-CoA reductase-like NAD-dependent aldehyde dehydrogenase